MKGKSLYLLNWGSEYWFKLVEIKALGRSGDKFTRLIENNEEWQNFITNIQEVILKERPKH